MDKNSLKECYKFEYKEEEEASSNSSVSSEEEMTIGKEKGEKALFKVKDKEDRATVE
jgi:hypothetical protein